VTQCGRNLDQNVRRGRSLAHASLLVSRERSVDEFLDCPAFDVERVRPRSEGLSEERSDRPRLSPSASIVPSRAASCALNF